MMSRNVHFAFSDSKLELQQFRHLRILLPKVTLVFLVAFLWFGFFSCTIDRSVDLVDFEIDTDGDGIMDDREVKNGTNKNDPCDPVQNTTYSLYDPLNLMWSNSDCDNDAITNGDELTSNTNPYGDPVDTIYAVPEFLPILSELQLFQGNLSGLQFNTGVHEYGLSTPLFSDYARNLRAVSIPNGEKMAYDGAGLLLFPNNTIFSKTLYYLNDERNPALGRKIVETQILIKKDGLWKVGNYLWNEEQTEAFLDDGAHTVQIDWIDALGNDRTVNYKVSSQSICFQCHNNNGSTGPIGPKSRALNFVHNGKNQIQYFKDNGLLTGAPDVSLIEVLPDWADTSLLLGDRARAYLDMNCAHCHQPGGSYNVSHDDTFEFRFETSFEDSNIYQKRVVIRERINTQTANFFMPYIGTTMPHTEGVDLINEYIESL